MEILIKGGKYPDFEAGDFKTANIGIQDGKIAYIGEDAPEAEKVIEAKGLVVSPGFIDIHMHEENLKSNEYQFSTGNYMVKMGVTTCVGGNC